MKYLILLLCLTACAEKRIPTSDQILVVDRQVQPMGRQEIIDAVKQCETSGLRAIPLYAKRRINGYAVETIVEVTCGPRYSY